jgi:hypothetical protein
MFHKTTGRFDTSALMYKSISNMEPAEIPPGRSNFHAVCPAKLVKTKTRMVATIEMS